MLRHGDGFCGTLTSDQVFRVHHGATVITIAPRRFRRRPWWWWLAMALPVLVAAWVIYRAAAGHPALGGIQW